MRVYGYVRVSTKGQAPGTSLDEQTAEILEKYPTAVIVREVASGASERPEFAKICEQLETGDTLVVCKLDRFCRTAKEGLGYVDYLRGKGAAVHILNMGVIDNSPMGRLMVTMLLAFAEFERSLIIERTQTGKPLAVGQVFGMAARLSFLVNKSTMRFAYLKITATRKLPK